MSEKYKSADESFLCLLDEAKAIFTRKSQEGQELLKENGKFIEEISQLRTENQKLNLKEESLSFKIKILEEKLNKSEKDLEKVTTELTQSKYFMKNFFTQLRSRITEIEEKGSYNADTFGYLIGDVGRSLCNTSFGVSQMKSPTKKQAVKLSTNKEKKRTRYENIVPINLTNISNTRTKKVTRNDLDAVNNDDTKNQSSTTTSETNSHIYPINIVNYPNNLLDPDLTLHSPIGPPSRASTPQGPLQECEETSTAGFRQMSPSLLPQGDFESPNSSLLSQMLSLEEEIPEETEPQSPTIPSRSHNISRNKKASTKMSQERKRKRSNEISFGSLLAEPHCLKTDCTIGDSRENCQRGSADDRRKSSHNNSAVPRQQEERPTLSPELVTIKESGCVKSGPHIISSGEKTRLRNEPRAETSSLLLFSPQHNKSADISRVLSATASKRSSTSHDRSNREVSAYLKDAESDKKQKLVFHLDLDENSKEESPPQRTNSEEDKTSKFKYVEVVRGKDKRAKLNGYFCSDCEKYYGSLKLTEQELQKRLNDCSRHRAQFRPPASTPEHFWDVGFMDTHEYIEKGFMRNESELPPEKRRLKRRRLKGKLPKYNNYNDNDS